MKHNTQQPANMRLLELLARATDQSGASYHHVCRTVLKKWPSIRRFTDEQLLELITDLQGE